MNQLTIQSSYTFTSKWQKSCIISFQSDEIQGLFFDNPLRSTNKVNASLAIAGGYDADDFIKADGKYNDLVFYADNWADITTCINAIKAEFQNKFDAFKSANDYNNKTTSESINIT